MLEVGNVLIEDTSSTRVAWLLLSGPTSAQATATAARKREECTVDKVESSSRMTDLTDLLFPTNQVGVDLDREAQRVAKETINRGQVESRDLLAEAIWSALTDWLRVDHQEHEVGWPSWSV